MAWTWSQSQDNNKAQIERDLEANRRHQEALQRGRDRKVDLPRRPADARRDEKR